MRAGGLRQRGKSLLVGGEGWGSRMQLCGAMEVCVGVGREEAGER